MLIKESLTQKKQIQETTNSRIKSAILTRLGLSDFVDVPTTTRNNYLKENKVAGEILRPEWYRPLVICREGKFNELLNRKTEIVEKLMDEYPLGKVQNNIDLLIERVEKLRRIGCEERENKAKKATK